MKQLLLFAFLSLALTGESQSWVSATTYANPWGGVNDIEVHNGDIYIGGSFDQVGGIVANRVAKWDGDAWSTVGNGFNKNSWCDARAVRAFSQEGVSKDIENVRFECENCDSLSPLYLDKVDRVSDNMFTFHLAFYATGESWAFDWQLDYNSAKERSFERQFIENYGDGNESSPFGQLIGKCFKVLYVGKGSKLLQDRYGSYTGRTVIINLVKLDDSVCDDESNNYED